MSRGTEQRSRSVLLAKAMVAGLVLSQRFVVPLGGTQVSLVVVLALVAIVLGTAHGLLVLDADRTRLYLLAVAAIVIVSLAHVALQLPLSWMSLAFLIVLYLPACFVVSNLSHADVEDVLWFFVRLMSGLAVLGISLFLLQLVGVPYQDYLSLVVPPAFLQQGYVISYPLYFGSDIFRANGAIFLEPSFFSFFCGLALLAMWYLGRRGPQVYVLAVALVCALSGNGFVVLFGGAVAMLGTRSRRRHLLRVALPVFAILLVAMLTPLGKMLLDRAGESNNPQSSGSLRMVQPYQILLPQFASSADRTLLGQGASSSDSYAQAINLPGLLSPVLPKLLFEYGLVAAVAFLAFLLFSFFWHPMAFPISVGLSLAYLVVNAALLQPTLAVSALLFTSVIRPATPQLARAEVAVVSRARRERRGGGSGPPGTGQNASMAAVP